MPMIKMRQSISSVSELEKAISLGDRISVLFYASWHKPSCQIQKLLEPLAEDYPSLRFLDWDVDKSLPKCIEGQPNIEEVPTIYFYQNGKHVGIFKGCDPPRLVSALDFWVQTQTIPSELTLKSSLAQPVPKEACKKDITIEERIKNTISLEPVMLFMKGDKDQPFCKFSKVAVKILNSTGVPYGSYNILEDPELREGLKKYSDWPTYPQLYIKGELIGGVDIISEMNENGSLKDILPVVNTSIVSEEQSPLQALLHIMQLEPIMLFIKGSLQEPSCSSSKQMIDLLMSENIKFGWYDVSKDPQTREALKEFTQWPTYPQLITNGKFFGGLDSVREAVASGAVPLKTLLQEYN